MSIEIFVLSDRRLNSVEDWQNAIDKEGLNLKLDRSRAFAELSGHLPALRGNDVAGFECDHWNVADVIECSPDVDFGRPWSQCLAFRFGGDFLALWGANAAATAYARATNGVVFDAESGEVLTPDEAVKLVRHIEHDLPS